MKFNVCETCGAGEGRAGFLINGECKNCHETRKHGSAILYSDLVRTEQEINRTFAILDEK